MTEIWKQIPSFPSYEASTHGRIRRAIGGKGCRAGRIIAAYNADIYPRVRLSENGKQTTVTVHALVAEAFHGPRPDCCEVSHLDGNSHNPAADNLCYETRRKNHHRKNEHGTSPQGERHAQARLNEQDIRDIRNRAQAGEMLVLIAADYGVHQGHISSIVARKYWSHVN